MKTIFMVIAATLILSISMIAVDGTIQPVFAETVSDSRFDLVLMDFGNMFSSVWYRFGF